MLHGFDIRTSEGKPVVPTSDRIVAAQPNQTFSITRPQPPRSRQDAADRWHAPSAAAPALPAYLRAAGSKVVLPDPLLAKRPALKQQRFRTAHPALKTI